MQEGYPKVGPIYINKSPGAVIAVIFLIILGIGALFWGVIESKDTFEFRNNCQKTTGKAITYSVGRDDGDTVYYAIYEYVVDGIKYTVEDEEFSYFEPIEGSVSSVYYDVDDPGNARTSLNNKIGWVLIFIGGAFVLVGSSYFVLRVRDKKLEEMEYSTDNQEIDISSVDIEEAFEELKEMSQRENVRSTIKIISSVKYIIKLIESILVIIIGVVFIVFGGVEVIIGWVWGSLFLLTGIVCTIVGIKDIRLAINMLRGDCF